MADSFQAQLVASLLTGTATDRTKTATATVALTEEFWATVKLPGSASDTVLKLNLLTDPAMLIVYGDEGISFKLNSTGTDAIGADPFAVVANNADGLGIDEVLLSNSDASEHDVTIIAIEA